jgi:hypothetical protein
LCAVDAAALPHKSKYSMNIHFQENFESVERAIFVDWRLKIMTDGLTRALDLTRDVRTRKNGLENAAVLLREAAISGADQAQKSREIAGEYMNEICVLFNGNDSGEEKLCLRIIGNAVADNDANRAILLRNEQFFGRLSDKTRTGGPELATLALSLLFNFCNNYGKPIV